MKVVHQWTDLPDKYKTDACIIL